MRSRRHVELTPAGQVLLERCEKIFQELEQAQIEVKRYGAGEKGSLRIGCEDGTTFGVLPPLLAREVPETISGHSLLCCYPNSRSTDRWTTVR